MKLFDYHKTPNGNTKLADLAYLTYLGKIAENISNDFDFLIKSLLYRSYYICGIKNVIEMKFEPTRC